jgi:pilus assembly protein CpaD
MNRKTYPILLALGLTVSACAGDPRSAGLESVHQPVVARSDYALDVASSGSGLAPAEAARLVGWFDAIRLGYGDQVAVDIGGNYDDGDTKRAIAGIAARYGLLLTENPAPTAGDIAPGAVRVVVSRFKASVPGCPEWKGSKIETFSNRQSSNYGCATNSNLAAMVANPVDLVRGQSGSGVTDATMATRGVKVLRDTPPTGTQGLKAESTGGNSR